MMVDYNQFVEVVADSFFDGNGEIAGLVIYAAVVLLMFSILTRLSMYAALIGILPVTIAFSLLGTLSTDFTVLVIIVTILGLGVYSGRFSTSWDPLAGRDRWGRRKE